MHIAIIGNGISGITVARHIRKYSDFQITVISAETRYFFSRTALMYVYMGHMKFENTKPYEDWFWKKNRIDLLYQYVKKVDFLDKKLIFSNNQTLNYDILIIACGSKPNKFGWQGQDLKGVQGLYSYQDLQSMERYSKNLQRAVVVGGGLIGIEMAEMFHSRNISVTFLVREKNFWDVVLPTREAKIINREIIRNAIDLRLETELKEILSDKNERVKAIITTKKEEIPCQFVGLTVGVSPNIDFLRDNELTTKRGVIVNEYFETNIENVYAIGDCAEFQTPLPTRKAIEQVWYTGRMHGETLAKTICQKPTSYKPDFWFNSAKFIDIEYQTYGTVLPKNPEGQKSFYWEDKEGKKCLHIVYEQISNIVKGFNLLGIRYRHQVCNRWLREKRTLEYVIENLTEANFDPEFFKTHEYEIIQKYNSDHPEKPIQYKRKKKLFNI